MQYRLTKEKQESTKSLPTIQNVTFMLTDSVFNNRLVSKINKIEPKLVKNTKTLYFIPDCLQHFIPFFHPSIKTSSIRLKIVE